MAQLTADIDPDDIVRGKTDSRGRFNLGVDNADKRIAVVILSEEPADKQDEETQISA